MDDVFKSIKAFLYDRSSSPLFGAFLVAWSVWNYRVISILLSNETLAVKFTNIDEIFKPIEITLFQYNFSIYGEIINGFIYPVLATLVYIYIYPILAKPVYEHSLQKQKELRDIKQKEEDNRLLSVEESRKLYNKISVLQSEFDEETEMYRNQISSLTQTIKELERNQNHEKSTSSRSDGFHDINDADPQEYADSIRNKVESMPDKEFQLSDLFNDKNWSELTASKKQAIGKRFKKLVDRGDYAGVTLKGKGPGNQLIYKKSSSKMSWPSEDKLPEQDERILAEFSGLDEGNGLVTTDIQKEIGIHIDEVRLHLEELANDKYLKYLGTTDKGEKLYTLDSKGRKYLVKNKLLK